MLVHLYRTPMKSKRWYLCMFAYSLTNAWIVYRRDCKALGVNGVPLKSFRIQLFRAASKQWPAKSSSRRSSSWLRADPQPVRGHRSHTPNVAVRFDPYLFHAPVHANRLTCKFCSRKGNIVSIDEVKISTTNLVSESGISDDGRAGILGFSSTSTESVTGREDQRLGTRDPLLDQGFPFSPPYVPAAQDVPPPPPSHPALSAAHPATGVWETNLSNAFLNGLSTAVSTAVRATYIGVMDGARLEETRRHAVHAEAASQKKKPITTRNNVGHINPRATPVAKEDSKTEVVSEGEEEDAVVTEEDAAGTVKLNKRHGKTEAVSSVDPKTTGPETVHKLLRTRPRTANNKGVLQTDVLRRRREKFGRT
ncbi:hypothetical protein F7725_009471 [Dissostichus mawsoni]|uniref:Uncharacterized protein n=1 Tax=Dissostichus mawsoni TaxID=36200 RepID=A0A7J5XLH8_DISMA|nr:hypothetical protein F7725_009471 [Dissostichus mawsoni]